MSSENGFGTGSSSDAFEEALKELIYEAILEGVNVEGGWDIERDEDDLPKYSVEIFEMTK